MYLNGVGVAKDESASVAWLRKARLLYLFVQPICPGFASWPTHMRWETILWMLGPGLLDLFAGGSLLCSLVPPTDGTPVRVALLGRRPLTHELVGLLRRSACGRLADGRPRRKGTSRRR